MADWTEVEKTATGPDGAKMAYAGGQWVPADKTATGPGGKKMAMLKEQQQQQPTPDQTPQPEEDGQAQKHTAKEKAINVATQTATAGVLSAFAPEIVTGLGMAASVIPGGAAVGVPLIVAGRAMRIGRLAMAAGGAIAGATGAVAGEVVRAKGGSETAVATAEMGAGILAPGPGVVSHFVPVVGRGAWNAMVNLADKLPISTNRAGVEGQKIIRGAFNGKLPEHDMYAMLKVGVDADKQATEAAAAKIMSDAYAKAGQVKPTPVNVPVPKYNAPTEADTIIETAKKQVEKLRQESADRIDKLRKASDGKLDLAERVGKQSEHKLHETVGRPEELSDTGEKLTKKVHENQTAVDEQRKATDAALRATRDQKVAEVEATGKFMTDVPEVKSLLQEIDEKLLTSAKGRDASRVLVTSGPDAGKAVGKAQVTEGGVERAYSNIKEALQNKRVAVAWDAETGAPTKFETFKTSFEALDQVRRKVQKAAFGKEAEGYEALGQNIAKDVYGKLSKAQESYLGGGENNAQRALQENYTNELKNSEKFKSQMGRMALNEDKSPAGMPKAFFKDRDGVRDLRELTGDHQMVDEAARSYTARTLAGKSSTEVKAWMASKENTDWMREVPGLQERTQKYADELAAIEKREGWLKGKAGERTAEKEKLGAQTRKETAGITEKAQADAAKVRADAEKAHSAAVTKAQAQQTKLEAQATKDATKQKQDILKQGYKESEAVKKAATDKAKAIVGNGFDAGKLQAALISGPVEHLPTMFKYLAGTPGGREAIEGSVRQALAATGPGKLRAAWDGRLKIALENGNVLTGAAMAKLDKDVQTAYLKMEPKEAQSTAKRLIEQAIRRGVGMAGAAVAGRAAVGGSRLTLD